MTNTTGVTPVQCKTCKQVGHARSSSVLCPYNLKWHRPPTSTPIIQEPVMNELEQQQQDISTVRCNTRGLIGHVCSNSSLCTRNPKRRRSPSPTPEQGTSTVRCSACGLTGHAHPNSRSCRLNPTLRHSPPPSPAPQVSKVSTQSTSSVRCASCHQLGHARSSNLLCPNNPKRRRLSPETVPESVPESVPEPEPMNHIPENRRHPAAFVEREQVTRHLMGRMDRTCPFCKAKLWVEVLDSLRLSIVVNVLMNTQLYSGKLTVDCNCYS